MLRIAAYDNAIHRAEVIALWTTAFGYATAHNKPALAIDKKIAVADGCMKINLQIVGGNDAVAAFYETLGYAVEPRVSMGKLVAAHIPDSTD